MSDASPPLPLPDFLRRLRGELDVAIVGDSATISRVRASLEWLAGSLPPENAEARRLLGMAADATRPLDGPDLDGAAAEHLLRAIRGAASAAAEHLTHPADFGRELLVIQAGQSLLSAMGRNSAEWLHAAPASASASVSQLSLDDAASLLMMIEPHERDEVERIRDTVQRLANDRDAAAPVREHATEAAAALDRALAAPADSEDATDALAEAVDNLDRAIRAREAAPPPRAKRSGKAGKASSRQPAPREMSPTEPSPRKAAPVVAPASAAPPPVDGDEGEVDQELIAEFLVECRDYLESAEGALLQLEADPSDVEAINTVFRAFHTVKGTSAFLGLDAVTEFAHEAESLFSRVRDRQLAFAGPVPDLALRSVDMVKALLASVEQVGARNVVRPPAYAGVIAALARVTGGSAGDETQQSGVDAIFGDLVAEVQGAARGVARAVRGGSAESSIRVRTDRLDRLIDMVGELVIAQTMVAQDDSVLSAGHLGLSRKVTHAGKIVRELHDLSLSMRMVPLRPTFQKMTRLVRDVAQDTGKQVAFLTDGEETEIDRNMVDALSDPLVHMVRNAVDHGIERPEQRVAAGKSANGTVRLSATHAGGSVVVQLTDDGRGLDRERILAKAVATGLVEAGAKMTDAEVFELIFAPGFSTAEQVTGVSGRGVGMDVVRRNIESLRGRIEISSVPGEGTTFTVRLPLTLAVTDGMLVQVGAERYVIPTTSIFMSFRPTADALTTVVGRGEMVTLRDEAMPVFRIQRLFNVTGARQDPCAALLVVVSVGEQRVALLVDELLGQHQVVAKALGDGVGKIHGISGGAILGDGRVGLILDIPELVALARRGTDESERLRSVA